MPPTHRGPSGGPGPSSRTIRDLGEFGLIARLEEILRARLPERTNELVLGIGDDAAVVRPEPGWDRVLTCDVQVAGRHFRPDWTDLRTIGRRAMTVNLSDCAAMGAEPRHALVSLGLPGTMPVTEVEDLYHGLADALAGTGGMIIGGNVSASGPEWFCDITLIGRVPTGGALTRSTARPGDSVLVTGSPGRSAAGLEVLLAVSRSLEESRSPLGSPEYPGILSRRERFRDALAAFLSAEPWAGDLVEAYFSPRARLAEGARLQSATGAKPALIDVSDGVPGDLAHICERSGTAAVLEPLRFPADPALEAAALRFGRKRRDWTLLPSDDYELLFTVPALDEKLWIENFASGGCAAAHRIGHVRPRTEPVPESGFVTVQGAGSEEIPASGWDHYRSLGPGDRPGDRGLEPGGRSR